MRNLFRNSTQDKIRETREEVKRGREAGFKHSEETKQKIREARARADQPDIETFDLKEILSKAKGDIEKSCEIYNINLSGRRIQLYAIDWDDAWIIDYSEFEHDLFDRIKKMLAWPQTQYVVIQTIEPKGEERQELTSILKVEDKYIIKGDYEVLVARRDRDFRAMEKKVIQRDKRIRG